MQRETYQPSVNRPPENVLSSISPTVATMTSATQPNSDPARDRVANAITAPARLMAATSPPTTKDDRLKRPCRIGSTGRVRDSVITPAATSKVMAATAAT